MFRYFHLYTIALLMVFSSVLGCQEQPKQDNSELKYTYYKSGKVESETQYANGKRNGYRKFYDETGRMVSEEYYVNGFAEGVAKAYYPTGSLQATWKYINGRMDGEMTSFYPDGKIEYKKIFDKGKLIKNTHYTREGKVDFEDKF